MRILVAGAGGAVGRALLPQLTKAGHVVFGITRSDEKASLVRSLGAQHLAVDALNLDQVLRAIEVTRPEVVVHQLTAIPTKTDIRRFKQQFALTNRLRTEGTDNLLSAARRFGVKRFVAQSFCGTPYARVGGPIKTEQDPLDTDPPEALRETFGAIRHLETKVTERGDMIGIALRYGFFYGEPETGGVGAMLSDIRARKVPLVGNGTGIWSFIHIDDVASATKVAIDLGAPGVYNIADDDPAPVSDWLPHLANILGAKPPIRIPVWLARLAVGEAGVIMMTEIRGASNKKAKRDLGWVPKWSWREGFRNLAARQRAA